MIYTVALPGFLIALIALRGVRRLVMRGLSSDAPRRRDTMGELHPVPPVERPVWVVEMFELALSEGLWLRVRQAVEGKIERGRVGHSRNPAEIGVQAVIPVAGGGTATHVWSTLSA
jgi:hypothetical protein